jgi:hypothetical protein
LYLVELVDIVLHILCYSHALISGDTLYHDVKDDSVRIMCVSLASVSMNFWCLLEPSSALKVIVRGNLVWGNANFEECFVALHMSSVRYLS